VLGEGGGKDGQSGEVASSWRELEGKMEESVTEVFPALRNRMALMSTMSLFQKKTRLVMVSVLILKKKPAGYTVVQRVLVGTGEGEDG
jgi:hypothetical protein